MARLTGVLLYLAYVTADFLLVQCEPRVVVETTLSSTSPYITNTEYGPQLFNVNGPGFSTVSSRKMQGGKCVQLFTVAGNGIGDTLELPCPRNGENNGYVNNNLLIIKDPDNTYSLYSDTPNTLVVMVKGRCVKKTYVISRNENTKNSDTMPKAACDAIQKKIGEKLKSQGAAGGSGTPGVVSGAGVNGPPGASGGVGGYGGLGASGGGYGAPGAPGVAYGAPGAAGGAGGSGFPGAVGGAGAPGAPGEAGGSGASGADGSSVFSPEILKQLRQIIEEIVKDTLRKILPNWLTKSL